MTSTRACLLAAALLAAAPAVAQPPEPSPAQRVDALAELMVATEWDFAPFLETYFQGAGPRASRAPIDLSPGAAARQRAAYLELLQKLARVPEEGLDETRRTTLQLLRLRAQDGVAGLEYPVRELALLTPTRGIVPNLLFLTTSTQPFDTEADFEAWLKRVEAISGNFDQAIVALGAAAKNGWTTPRALVSKSLAQMMELARKPGEGGPMWAPLAKYPASAGPAKRADFEGRYRQVLEKKFAPALQRLIAYVRDDYLPKARTSAGLGGVPLGDRAYRAQVRINTTLDLEPEKVHALGLAEVARVRGRLLEVARGLGFTGEMQDYAAWTASNAAAYPFKEPGEVLDYLRGVNARVVPQLPKLFARLPKTQFQIRLADPLLAASASATYSQPSEDGKRPAYFTMPVVDARKVAQFRLTSLLLHEGMPGHHLDIGRKVEMDLPRFRRAFGFTAYSEGWGLYAEGLGHDLGVYDDPWALLGRYEGELHRAARLVVDTGMHAKGWSREQAIQYLVKERGQTEAGATVAVERYMGSPGQALAYKVGELEILKLRDEARAKLGERFDLREFHEALLGAGPLPLPLLRTRVEAWIRAR